MTRKNKLASAGQRSRTKTARAKPPVRQPRAASGITRALTEGPGPRTRALEGAVAPQCPTHVYDGTVLLNDGARQSFLQTGAATYLMLLDADCSGLYTPQRVAAAYDTFSVTPGRNQRLTCNGFLHEDGTSWVLHVVG